MKTQQSYESVAPSASYALASRKRSWEFGLTLDARPENELGNDSQAQVIYDALANQTQEMLTRCTENLLWHKEPVPINEVQSIVYDIQHVLTLVRAMQEISNRTHDYLTTIHYRAGDFPQQNRTQEG